MTKAEKNRLKLNDLEIKYEQLLNQVKNDCDLKKDDKPKAVKKQNFHVIFYLQMILVTVQTILKLTMPGKNA